MDAVNERTTRYLTAAFRSKTGTPAAPASVTYRVDCLTTGQNVRPWSAVTPGASVEIVLDADDNALRVASNERELRRVTVVASYGAGASDQVVAENDYEVRKVRFL